MVEALAVTDFFCRICDTELGRVYREDELQGRSWFWLWPRVKWHRLRVWSHGWFRHPRQLYRHWRAS